MNFAKFKLFDDFIRFAAASQIPYILHTVIKGKSVYFIHLGLLHEMVYYFERDEPFKEKYVVYNRFQDKVGFTDKMEMDPQRAIMPILEVEATNVFSEYPPK